MPAFWIETGAVRRAYRLLGKRAPKVIRPALRKAARPMQAKAKQLAPVHTGLTARSMKVRARKRSRKGFGIDVRIGEGDYKGKTFYSAFPNFGTKGQKAQHYMERAFDEAKGHSVVIADREIEAGILREWKAL